MEYTYWNHKGKYQVNYDKLVDKLVPAEGSCETVAGEMIRAASNLGYDFYNNGMCNDTTSALNYLWKKQVIDKYTYQAIKPLAGNQRYKGNYDGDLIQIAIESVVDKTMEKILNNPELLTEKNSEDMLDY